MADDPFAKLGALDQKLYQRTETGDVPVASNTATAAPVKVSSSASGDQVSQLAALTLSENESNDPHQPTPVSKREETAGQSTLQSTDESTDQSTNLSAEVASGEVVPRPKAFYITTRLDKRLDEAVRYFQEVHGIKKADRSTVINAMLDDEEKFDHKSLGQLADRVIGQLASRLTN